MEGEQFSLCWNNFHSNLSSGFHSLLKDEDLVDVTLAAEGKFLKAHKTVLSVCSPFFKDLFRVNPCKHPIVILPDVNYGALCSLLHFMYQGEVSVGQEEIPTFMRVAEMLKVKGLTDNSNSSSPSDTNGFTNTNRGYTTYPDQRQNIMKRPRPVKKVIRPMQPLRPIESPKLIKSPQPQQSQTTQSQPPPLKKPHLDPSPPPPPSPSPSTQSQPQPQLQPQLQLQTQQHAQPPQPTMALTPPKPPSDFSDTPLIKPKLEPLEHDEETSHSGEEHQMDISHMLDTTLGEQSPGPSPFPNWPPPGDFGEFGPPPPPQDTNQPGLVLLKSGRGQLVLIHNGHIYTLCDKKDIRSLWVCVKKKTLNCPGYITTLSGPLLLSYSGHNHPQLHDVIKKLQVPNCSISPELTL